MRLEGAKNLDPFAIGHGNVCGVDARRDASLLGSGRAGGRQRAVVSVPTFRAERDRVGAGKGRPHRQRRAHLRRRRERPGGLLGPNSYGQLGDGTTTRQLNPVWVAGLNDAADVAVGDTNTCVRTRDGHVLCWGDNGYGQLGDGTTESRMHPTRNAVLQPRARVDLPGAAAGAAIDRGITAFAMSTARAPSTPCACTRTAA